MEIQDYSQRLTDARNGYLDSAKKLKENYDGDLAGLEKTHDYKTKKQAATYNKERLELEDANKATSDLYAKKTKDEIDRRQTDFIGKMKESEGAFNRNSAELRDEFRNRLHGVSNSFQKAKNQSELLQKQELRDTKEFYADKQNRHENSFNAELKGIKEKSEQQFYDYRKGQTSSQKNLVSQHEDRVTDLNKNSNNRLNTQKNKSNDQLATVIKTNAEEMEQMKSHHSAVADKIKGQNFRNNAERTETFSHLSRNLEDRNVKENMRTSKENADSLNSQEDKFRKDLRNVRNLASQMDKESESRATNASIEKTRMEEGYESRLQKLKSQHEEYKGTQQDQLSRSNENFTLSIKQEKLKSADRLQATSRDSELRESQLRSKGRGELIAKEDRFNLAMSDQESFYGSKLTKQEKSYNDLLNQKHNSYQRNLNLQNSGHKVALRDLHETMAEDKTRFVEETKRGTHHEIENVKAELTRNFTIKLETLETQLAQKEIGLQQVIADYDQKLIDSKKKGNKELDRYMLLESERRVDEKKALKATVNQKDSDNAKKIADLRRRFDSSISRTKHHNDLQVQNLVSEYEDELTIVKNNANKDLKIKLELAKTEYDKLKKGDELRLQTVKDQYEMKIEKMRLVAQETEVNRGNRS